MKLKPKNWSDFQHYNKRTPPWIKLHRGLLDDFKYQRLPVASKALAPMLWLIASEHEDGEFDGSMEFLAFRLRWDKSEMMAGLKPLIDNGFFVITSGSLADCYQHAPLETEGETETEAEFSPNGERASPDGDTPEDPPPKKKENTPFSKIVDLYHACCPSLPQVMKLTPGRQQAIRARWRNELKTLDDWEQFFAVVEQSDFLTGRAGASGGRSKAWTADLDFLIKQGNAVKVMEGKYD